MTSDAPASPEPTPAEPTPLDMATEALQVVVAMLGEAEQLPEGLWDDPFVLGFVFYCTYAYALRAGSGDIPFKQLRPAYEAALGAEGNAIFSQSLIHQMEEHEAFGEGMEAATKFIAATGGQATYDDDPAVLIALERARDLVNRLETEGSSDQGLDFDQALFVYLYDELFIIPLRQRFPEMAEND